MNQLTIREDIPFLLETTNPVFCNDLRAKAKKMIYFENYMPKDSSLGDKGKDIVIDAEEFEKQEILKIDRRVTRHFEDEKLPLKIIPKKPTIDITRKLAGRLRKLKLKTELSLIDLLREKFDPSFSNQDQGITSEFDKIQIEKNTKEDNDRRRVEDVTNSREQSRKFEMINWLEVDQYNAPLDQQENINIDLLKGISKLELEELENEEDEEF